MPTISGIAHVELSVADIDRSAAWYNALLGSTEVFRARDEAGGFEACAIREPASGIVLAFTAHDAREPEPFSPRRAGLDHLAFAVDSPAELEAWKARLGELGIPADTYDQGFALGLTCSDPDGIALEFYHLVGR